VVTEAERGAGRGREADGQGRVAFYGDRNSDAVETATARARGLLMIEGPEYEVVGLVFVARGIGVHARAIELERVAVGGVVVDGACTDAAPSGLKGEPFGGGLWLWLWLWLWLRLRLRLRLRH
jgi:hypothetical protein